MRAFNTDFDVHDSRSTDAVDDILDYLDDNIGPNGAYLTSVEISGDLSGDYHINTIGHGLSILADSDLDDYQIERWSGPSTSPVRWFVERTHGGPR